jgi:phosphoesterase RecJ-like protein
LVTKKATLEKASQLICQAHQPLLVCHVAPDGDALGSLTGLAYALQQLDQAPIAACSDTIPSHLSYIPHVDTVVRSVRGPFDLIVALDCSDLRRLGDVTELPQFGQRPLINIDHHVTNVGYGDVDLVDPAASSTAEVLLRLIDHLGVPLDETLATCLLVGVVTDTRGFRTDNVTPPTMETALRLMEAGASLPSVTRRGLDTRPTVGICLWGAALSHLRSQDGVIWTSIPVDMRRGVGYQGDGDAGLASFLVSAEEADVAVVFVEQGDGRVDVGLRADPGFDVAQFALRFGGGGHALAAGFSIPGPLETAEERVLNALQVDLARQRASHGQRNPQPR